MLYTHVKLYFLTHESDIERIHDRMDGPSQARRGRYVWSKVSTPQLLGVRGKRRLNQSSNSVRECACVC